MSEARVKAEDSERSTADHARAEGFDQGRREGLAEGLRQAAERAGASAAAEESKIVDAIRGVLNELGRARGELIDQARREAIQFALELAEKVVNRVALADPDAAQANVAKVLGRAPEGVEAKVRVNPAQLDALRERFAAMAETSSAGSVELMADEDVPPGGAKLVTPNGELDATIRTQLDAVAEALLGPRMGTQDSHGTA